MGLVKYSNAKKIIKMPECFTIYQVKDLQEELLSFEPEGDFIALEICDECVGNFLFTVKLPAVK